MSGRCVEEGHGGAEALGEVKKLEVRFSEKKVAVEVFFLFIGDVQMGQGLLFDLTPNEIDGVQL